MGKAAKCTGSILYNLKNMEYEKIIFIFLVDGRNYCTHNLVVSFVSDPSQKTTEGFRMKVKKNFWLIRFGSNQRSVLIILDRPRAKLF